MLDVEALGKATAALVSDHIERATAPLIARIAALEASATALGQRLDSYDEEVASTPDVKQLVGEAVAAITLPEAPEPIAPDIDAIGEMIERSVTARVAEIPAPKDGTSVTAEDVRPMLEDLVAGLPAPVNGKDADPALVKQMVDDAVSAIELPPAPEPIAPDMDAIGEMIERSVAARVAEIPVPKDGASVTAEDVGPMLAELVERAVAAIPAPKDGVGVADALIDRAGALVLTLSDGRTKELGEVVGRDADQRALEDLVKQLVDAIPKPRDGMDGLGFDDMSVEHDGARTFTLRFARGEIVKEFAFKLPIVLDAGVWREGKGYEAGDGVTWGGNYWIARRDTTDKPETSDAWRLSVKKGQNAKREEPVRLAPPPTPNP